MRTLKLFKRLKRLVAPGAHRLMVERVLHTFDERGRYHHGRLLGFVQELLIMYIVSPIYGIGSGLGKCFTNVEIWKKILVLDGNRTTVQTRWRPIKIGVHKCTRGRWELQVWAGPVWKRAVLARLIAWHCKDHPGLTLEDFNSKDARGNYNYQADHINMDCRCTWVGNVRLLTRSQHVDVYRKKWRGHVGIRKRPAAQR